MKVPFVCFVLFILFSPVFAEIKIDIPKDMKISFSDVEIVSGSTNNPFEFSINNIPMVPKGDGSFICGAILHPGKNLIEVKNEKEKKKLRILRMIGFPDVDDQGDGKKHSARSYILVLATLGMIEGMPDGSFHPDDVLSRGDFLAWVVKAKNLKLAQPNEDVYFDVPKEHWRAPQIEAAKIARYIGEYPNNLLGIDSPIPRSEADEILGRAEGSTEAAIPAADATSEMTRAQAVILISRLPSVQRQVKFLSDFNRSYTIGKFCGINVSPEVESFMIDPASSRLGEQAIIKMRAAIALRQGFSPLAKVKVDLSSIGGAYDAEMVDDGTNGDEVAGDGTYSLNFTFVPKEPGNKEIIVKATDQLGWEGKARSVLDII